MHDNHYLVPTHIEGNEKDIAHSYEAKSVEDAEDWFVDAKERLLDINNWCKYGAIGNMDFSLTDAHGRAVRRRARKGDHIRIDMDGLGNGGAGGFDWATIEAIEYDDYPDEDMETFAIRIHPSEDPQYKNIDEPMLFLGGDASGTFVIGRYGTILSATYHGRNELAYAHEPEQDVAVLETEIPITCWLGLADSQWQELMRGLLK